jgi:hypothetical protein
MAADITPRAPAWPLRWPDSVLDLPDLLEGEMSEIYLVGGAVRDALLGRPIKDVDIATTSSGIRLARLIANRLHGDFYPLDPERDVGRALVDTAQGRLVFDVASLRGPTLLADLTDRDFTLNAMAVDLQGDLGLLIDPLGGEKDTITRVIRQCGPNALSSDPLRTLRAVRQSVQLKARIEKETLAAIRSVSPRLAEVSPERVRDEFYRILALEDVASALRVAEALGLLSVVVPAVGGLRRYREAPDATFDGWTQTLASIEMMTGILTAISPRRTDETAAEFSLGMIVMALDRYRGALQARSETVWPDHRSHAALLMLALLLCQTGAAGRTAQANGDPDAEASAQVAETVAGELRLSNAERARLVAIVRYCALPNQLPDLTPVTIYRFWKATGDAGVDVCLVALARYLGRMGPYLKQDAWIGFLDKVRTLLEAYYEQRDRLVSPPAVIDGKRLMTELALPSGPVVGQLLERIREAQVAGEVATTEDALAFARRALEP